MAKLWNKKGEQLHALIEQFETGHDFACDMQLVTADIYGSLAHAKMLSAIGILTKKEYKEIHAQLIFLLKQFKSGRFTLQFGDEDIHTKIENYLVEKIGDIGKKIHTGRSRNDQVLVDLRLYTKEQLLLVQESVIQLASLFLNLEKQYEKIPMPGYTHMQKAMPSSVGLWLGAYAESFIDDVTILQNAYTLNDQSPLGSGASYGVPPPLDRKLTADLLGFSKVQNNTLYCQNSRGKIESVVLFALVQVALDISKFASDLLLFTTSEFNFFSVDAKLTTGSSIMPQKKNIDIAELLRSKIHIMEGYFSQVLHVGINLPSGYNRDMQDTKKPYMDAFDLLNNMIAVMQVLVTNIQPNEKVLMSAMTQELYATHAVYELVEKGMPFRDAYKQIGQDLSDIHIPETVLIPANHLSANKKIVQQQSIVLQKQSKQYSGAIQKLLL